MRGSGHGLLLLAAQTLQVFEQVGHFLDRDLFFDSLGHGRHRGGAKGGNVGSKNIVLLTFLAAQSHRICILLQEDPGEDPSVPSVHPVLFITRHDIGVGVYDVGEKIFLGSIREAQKIGTDLES